MKGLTFAFLFGFSFHFRFVAGSLQVLRGNVSLTDQKERTELYFNERLLVNAADFFFVVRELFDNQLQALPSGIFQRNTKLRYL